MYSQTLPKSYVDEDVFLSVVLKGGHVSVQQTAC